jgi:hypothetical protein
MCCIHHYNTQGMKTATALHMLHQWQPLSENVENTFFTFLTCGKQKK